MNQPTGQASSTFTFTISTPKRAARAIFDLLKKDDSSALDQQLALQALQDMRDASYGPQLLALMNTSSNVDEKAKLLVAAARLDPTNTLPIIQPLLKSSNEKGVTALAATEQPATLPILVRALSDSSLPVRSAAAQGLVSLTRKTPSKDDLFGSGTDPETDPPSWSAWLRTNPQLPIHPIHECHEVGP
jgi:HEAT repeat protein